MAVYAAQVYCMDYNVGKLVEALKKQGKFDNTLILFLSDNGGAGEPYQELGGRPQSEVNDPAKFWSVSYGMGWANVSNTPFRRFKVETYEGGISTPLIAHWPAGIKSQAGEWNNTPYYLIDIMPTLIEVAKTKYPTTFHNGNKILPNEGISMLPVFTQGKGNSHQYMYWEHEDNCAIRYRQWKAVKKLPSQTWELYDMEKDRSEKTNLADQDPALVNQLNDEWYRWANSHFVLPKGDKKEVYKKDTK